MLCMGNILEKINDLIRRYFIVFMFLVITLTGPFVVALTGGKEKIELNFKIASLMINEAFKVMLLVLSLILVLIALRYFYKFWRHK